MSSSEISLSSTFVTLSITCLLKAGAYRQWQKYNPGFFKLVFLNFSNTSANNKTSSRTTSRDNLSAFSSLIYSKPEEHAHTLY